MNFVNSFTAACMQFAMRNGEFGMNIQFTANLNRDLASLYTVPPQFRGVMFLINVEGGVKFYFNVDGNLVELTGVCPYHPVHPNGHCPRGVCYGGICYADNYMPY